MKIFPYLNFPGTCAEAWSRRVRAPMRYVMFCRVSMGAC